MSAAQHGLRHGRPMKHAASMRLELGSMQHNGALMATLPPSIKPTKADDAYDELKRLIVSLRIAPGEPLNERTLMTTMDVGRTPLREAIQRLTLEHLVTSLPRRGYYVRDLSISEL